MDPTQLQDMRKRVLEGKPYTREEFAQAIRAQLGERIKQATNPAPSKTKSVKKSVESLDDLMG